MKKFINYSILFILFATLLGYVSCSTGDDDPDPNTGFTVGGTITGLDGDITLSLNGTQETFSSDNFTFKNRVEDQSPYLVQFVSSSTDQVCTVSNGQGDATSNITNVEVTCVSGKSELRYDNIEIIGQLTSGDFNGDGSADLAFSIRTLGGHPTGGNNHLTRFAYGSGSGTFNTTIDVPLVSSAPGGGQLGHLYIAPDLNNDNIDDFVTSGGVMEALAGNSTNDPQALFNYSKYAGSPIHSADLNGDGFNDIVGIIFGGSISNFFSVFLNNGGEGISDISYVGYIYDDAAKNLKLGSPNNFTLGDFDGDSKTDILAIAQAEISGENGLALALFSSNGDGTFDYPTSLDGLSPNLYLGEYVFNQESKEIAYGDFDGDGDMDLAITSTNTYLQVMINDGNGHFSEAQHVAVGVRPIHIRIADFNNDNKLDLASISADSKTVDLTLGNGDGTFNDDGSQISFQMDGNSEFYDMEIADFDEDGFMDIALGEDGTNPPDTGRGSVQLIMNPGK